MDGLPGDTSEDGMRGRRSGQYRGPLGRRKVEKVTAAKALWGPIHSVYMCFRGQQVHVKRILLYFVVTPFL